VSVHERLRRLLFLVPYVSKHPGVSVDDLARALNVDREDLLEELDLLTCVGRPPFNPDDYIDIYVENDRVYVDLDQRLSAPPRLTAGEAAALAAAAELLRPAADDALQGALKKLERIIPPAARDRFRDMYRKIDASAEVAPQALAPLTRAILERLEVTFDYAAQGKQAEARRVRPYELLSHRGQWYLQGFCHTRQDSRLFRLDRMENLALTDTPFQPPADARGAAVPNPARSTDASARVRFSKVAAPYVLERFGSDARPLGDGGVEVRVAADERWLTQWVLSFGGEAEVLEPVSARAAVARAARASLGF
jgi:proteasome accessory factor C